MPLQILCADGPLLAVNKPAGLPTQAPAGIPSLEAQVRDWLKANYDKPGGVYLGIPHRLDRPVSGVVVFARNSKAAARLAEQFRQRQVMKVYWAVTERPPDPAGGYLQDWLSKIPDQARVEAVPAGTSGARKALLRFRTIGPVNGGTLLEVIPETGRMHQIRIQLGRRGWPVVGDQQYGAGSCDPANRAGTRDLANRAGTRESADGVDAPDSAGTADARGSLNGAPDDVGAIALHAMSLRVLHPVRYDPVLITAPLPAHWQRFLIPEGLFKAGLPGP